MLQLRTARGISCAGAVTADGGRVSADMTLSVRVMAQLLLPSTLFTLCHAFNRSDDGTPTEEDFLPQGLLNVTVSYPAQACF